MKLQPFLSRIALALGVLALAGCGGGSPLPPDGGDPGLGAVPQMVVQYDHNGDDEPDWLTLDTSVTPFRILEVLEGVPNGDPVDTTSLRAGETIDPEISKALADHLADSFAVAARTEMDVLDQAGVSVRVVVFE